MESPPPLTPAPPQVKELSRIPAPMRFPLVAIISFSLSTLLHTFTADLIGAQLASASKNATSPLEISMLIGWRIAILCGVWLAGYDYEDVAALMLLINQPYYYLLYAFFSIPFVPVIVSLAFDILVATVPFALLRPHKRRLEALTPKTTNQALAVDWQIMTMTGVLGASIYAATFYITYQANLGIFLIYHFDNIPTLEARDSSLVQLFQLFACTGLSTMLFLFRPAIAAPSKPETKSRTKKPKKFNPETASLSETLAHNFKFFPTGWSQRGLVLGKRTAALSFCTLANTFVRVYGTVEGSHMVGALGYGALWAASTILVGVGYGLMTKE